MCPRFQMENEILRIYATPDTLSLLPDTRISGMGITNNYSSGISGWGVLNASRGNSETKNTISAFTDLALSKTGTKANLGFARNPGMKLVNRVLKNVY